MNKQKSIFVALTPYQLLVSFVYAKYITLFFNNDCSIIYQQSSGHKIYLNEDKIKFIEIPDLNQHFISKVWQRLYYSGNLFWFCPLKKELDVDGKINLFVFNDYFPISNNLMRIVSKGEQNTITIIEEGVGMYATSTKKRRSIKDIVRLLFTTLLGSPMIFHAIAESEELQYAIVDNIPLYKIKSASEKQTVLQQHKKQLFEQSPSFIEAVAGDLNIRVGANMLFIGQPLFEVAQNPKLEHDYLISLFKPLIDDGNVILIKPHPRESVEKYEKICEEMTNVHILKGIYQTLPIECMLNTLGIKLVFTYFSSAAVNIAQMMDDVVVLMTCDMNLSKPIIEWNKAHVNNPMHYDKESIMRSSNNNIFFLKDIDELLSRVAMNKSLKGESDCIKKGVLQLKRGMFSEIDTILNRC